MMKRPSVEERLALGKFAFLRGSAAVKATGSASREVVK
jgi:hypothetical protein